MQQQADPSRDCRLRLSLSLILKLVVVILENVGIKPMQKYVLLEGGVWRNPLIFLGLWHG